MAHEEIDEAGKLFVGGIARSTSEETLRTHFEQYGKVKNCVLMKDRATGFSRGFGFVMYEEPSSVAKALKARPHTLDNKVIDPKPCTPQSIQRQKKSSNNQFSKAHKIFVGGISMEATEADLQEYFERYGVVVEVVFVTDKSDNTRRHKGFGFVTFEDESSVEQAVAKHYHFIKDKRCEAKPAESREKMDAMKGAPQQYGNNMNQMGGGYGNQGGNMGYGGGQQMNQGMRMGGPMMNSGYGTYTPNYPTSYPQQYGGGYGGGFGGPMGGMAPQMAGGNMGTPMGGAPGYGGGMPNQQANMPGMGTYPQQQSGYGPMKPGQFDSTARMPKYGMNGGGAAGNGAAFNQPRAASAAVGAGGGGYHPYRR